MNINRRASMFFLGIVLLSSTLLAPYKPSGVIIALRELHNEERKGKKSNFVPSEKQLDARFNILIKFGYFQSTDDDQIISRLKKN
jgi:hypothetical protein